MTLIPGVGIIAYGIWFLIWKRHYFAVIAEEEESNARVMPEKFCVEVEMDERYIEEE